jgi:hypothetical protein
MDRRAVKAPPWADSGIQLVEKLVARTNYADNEPVIYGWVDGRTLGASLLSHVDRLGQSAQREDGLFHLDLGYVEVVWIVQTSGQQTCASFYTFKVIDRQSAASILLRLYDSLGAVARELHCSLGSASNGEVDSPVADILASGRTMMVSELFG